MSRAAHAIYIKCSQKGLSTSSTHTTDAISRSRNIPIPKYKATRFSSNFAVPAATTSSSTRSWWSSRSHR